jgi:hypothetical protein
MAFLGDIVDGINTALKAKLTAFPTTCYSGVAYPIARKKDNVYEFIPAIISPAGEAKYLTFDDIEEMGIYHRIVTSSYSQDKSQSYGDGYTSFQQNYDIDLVVMADRRRVEVTPDVLEAAIASNFPAGEKPQGINYLNILPVSANHNSRSLFSQEFQGVNYHLKPEHVFFSIRYRVELKYVKGCISLCQCD